MKLDNANHSLSLLKRWNASLRNLFSFHFPFLSSDTFFSHFFDQNVLIYIYLSLFINTIQNNTILSSSNITYWMSVIFLVKAQSALR